MTWFSPIKRRFNQVCWHVWGERYWDQWALRYQQNCKNCGKRRSVKFWLDE